MRMARRLFTLVAAVQGSIPVSSWQVVRLSRVQLVKLELELDLN